MFYHNTKFRFALADGAPEAIRGGIIAASAMPSGQLIRRVRAGLRRSPYLQHRLYDPQLYLAGLDRNVASATVATLATHPWFGSHSVPQYDSDKHGSIKEYKDAHETDLIKSWRGTPLTKSAEIAEAIRASVEYQLQIGCEGVILPSPLTTMSAPEYRLETKWLDIGVDVVRELRTVVPVYATIALSDNLLRGIDPFKHSLVHTITSQIASRAELTGAYIVVEQTAETGYACTSCDVLTAMLVIADDLNRGAGRQIITNYLGSFGAVMSAAGAGIWASGYYRSQRRLRLADYEEKVAMAMPRMFSLGLIGDVGLANDLLNAHVNGLGKRVLLPSTDQTESLMQALELGTFPQSVPQWEYRQSNLTAAAAHYLSIHESISRSLDSLESDRRTDFVHRWLKRAAKLAGDLSGIGVNGQYSDIAHQRPWLDAYERWLSGRP
jgi:hypothetical protein